MSNSCGEKEIQYLVWYVASTLSGTQNQAMQLHYLKDISNNGQRDFSAKQDIRLVIKIHYQNVVFVIVMWLKQNIFFSMAHIRIPVLWNSYYCM